MQFDVQNVDTVKRKVVVKVEPEELGTIEKSVLRKYQKSASVPGFRKGHVPASLLKRSYGEAIRADVLETAISEYYQKLINELGFKPVSRGEITHIDFEKVEGGLEFHVEFEEEPKIELKKYKGLKVEKEIALVTDEMVEQALAGLQENFATVKTVEKSREGDYLTFNAQLLDEGDIPVVGRKYEDINVKIGSGDFDIDLEKQLVGLEIDQEKIIRRTSPLSRDERKKDGPPENYKITVTAIEERELPPIDDELAKNIQDDNIETLAQLKEALRKSIQDSQERRSLQQFNSRLVDELLKENPFEVPESMVQNYLSHVIHDMKHQYPDEKIDESLVREKYRAEVIHNIRWILLKEAIQEAENIKVSEAEILERIDASRNGDDEKKKMRRDQKFKERLKENLLEEKLLKFLAANADITEVFPQNAGEGIIH